MIWVSSDSIFSGDLWQGCVPTVVGQCFWWESDMGIIRSHFFKRFVTGVCSHSCWRVIWVSSDSIFSQTLRRCLQILTRGLWQENVWFVYDITWLLCNIRVTPYIFERQPGQHVTFLFSCSPAMCNGFSIIQGHVVTMTKSIMDRSAHPKQSQTWVTVPSKTLPNNYGSTPFVTNLLKKCYLMMPMSFSLVLVEIWVLIVADSEHTSFICGMIGTYYLHSDIPNAFLYT